MAEALIGIMSCWADRARGAHDAIRATWVTRMRYAPALDYVFFMGRPPIGTGICAADEVALDVDDAYGSLPWKSQAMRMWALLHGYKHMFKADRDTYLHPERLAASGYQYHDYAGHFPGGPIEGKVSIAPDGKGRYCYASGGCGYWTSEHAMRAIVAAPVDDKAKDNYGQLAEDLWMANILIPAGMQGYHDPRYLFKGQFLESARDISVHLSTATGVYHPSWMLKAHRESK